MAYTKIIIALFSLLIASVKLVQTTYKSKLKIHLGKHIRFDVLELDRIIRRPCILINLTFMNYGGKISFFDNMKIRIVLKDPNYEFELLPFREFSSMINESETRKDVVPFTIPGRSAVHKKYVFFPLADVSLHDLPKKINYELIVSVTRKGIYKEYSSYRGYLPNGIESWSNLQNRDCKPTIGEIARFN